MRITDEQIDTLKQKGFVIIENFLTEKERKETLNGFYKEYAPPYEEYIKGDYEELDLSTTKRVFPWDDSALNHVCTHPDMIDEAERIMGTREIRLSEAHLGMKYYQESPQQLGTPPGAFHMDYRNNTLGPKLPEDDFMNILFFYCFDDVGPGMAPIMMTPNGRPDSDAVPMIVPGGSLCIYTIFTRHAASSFTKSGHRPVAWIGFSRKDRPWDGARYFSYKTGVSMKGMERFIVEANPRQLELIGFPPPGDPRWTKEMITGMAKRYKGFNPTPYLQTSM
ncbi:hypothetical protein ACTWQL_04830 [Pseudalkalibacillus sp. R45]|uniref:hypothetical protein n=1 Tax=Pseudalkalibacillus sp. R45 TaxID=3457433 RepID=UPI003FCED7F3